MNIGTFGETTALAILVGIFLATILLVVLLSMWGRGRRKAKESGVSQVANGATAVITAEPAAERDEGKEGGGSVKERVGEVVTEGRAYHTAPMGEDPVEAMVGALMEGQGELTGEESKRVRLYNPERVVAVVLAMSEGVSGSNKEIMRARLSRIRELAESQQVEMSSPAEAEVVGETTRASETPLEDSVEEQQTSLPQEDSLELDEELSFVEAEDVQSVADDFSESGEDGEEQAEVESLDMEWESETLEMEEEPESLDMEEEPEILEMEMEVPEVVEDLEVEEEVDFPEESAEEESAVSDHLDLAISTAQDVFDLPEGERVDALSFLEEEQLLEVIRLDEGGILCLAAVDMLGEMGTPQALEALEECLESANEQVQVHSVEAVERILKDG